MTATNVALALTLTGVVFTFLAVTLAIYASDRRGRNTTPKTLGWIALALAVALYLAAIWLAAVNGVWA